MMINKVYYNFSEFVKCKSQELYKKNFSFIIILIFFLRILYVFLNENGTGDTKFYNEIVNGIINNCGIGTITSDGACEKIVGHFSPSFFYLMAASNISGIGAKGLVTFISILGFFSSLLLSFKIKKHTNNLDLAKATFIFISLSPLTLGWSRSLLMEPIITNLGICLLIIFIDIFFKGFSKTNFIFLLFLQIFSIYIKPTSILFSIPIAILAFNKLKLKSVIYLSLIWVLVISISIAPWGLRNLKYGGNKPFESAYSSNFIPSNTSGYLRWIKSWVVTEHELAKNGFKIWRNPMNLSIEKSPLNPFITNSELIKLNEKYNNVDQFSTEDNKFFLELSKQREKRLGILGNIMLYSSKTISLMLNPLNSWGWPIEILRSFSKDNINLRENIDLILQPNIFIMAFSKIFLFFYRLIFFIIFFGSLIKTLIKEKLSILKTNSLTNILGLSSMLFLMGLFYLIVIRYSALEHRYISIVIPWMEVSSLFYIFKFKKQSLGLKK